MKELSIEEKAKAKAYDVALKAAIVAHKDEDRHLKATLERIFPELKESDDERIRKEMIFYFQEEIPQCSIQEHSDKMREFISWLKRQEIECIKLELKAGNSYFCYKSRWERADNETFKKGLIYKCNKDGVLDNFVIKNPEQHFIEIKDERIAWLEKQGEQKLADTDNKFIRMRETKPKDISEFLDRLTTVEQEFLWEHIAKIRELDKEEQNPVKNVEPKFKVGDYIISNNNSEIIYRITGTGINELGNPDYVCEHVGREKEYNGRIYNMSQDKVDANFRLWTIQNAKSGDVLVSKYEKPFIYNGIFDSFSVGGFCGMESFGFAFTIAPDNHKPWTNNIGIHPATKEQCDFLFKKMHEAGYEWDAEKKKLKKIIDEEQIKKNLQDNSFRKMFEQKSWSEEDDKILKSIIINIENLQFSEDMQEKYHHIPNANKSYYQVKIDWLKSLKDRVQLKQELSQEAR